MNFFIRILFILALCATSASAQFVTTAGSGLTALTPLVSVAKSADFTTIAGNLGSSIDVTTGASPDITITLLSAVTAGAGALQWVAKVDSGAAKVIVTDGVTQRAWLSNINDTVIMRSNGSSWAPYWYSIAPRTDNYAAGSSNWTKPPLAKIVWAGITGGGGGGGSGAQCIANCSGGAGGQPGGYTYSFFSASQLGTTEPVVIGAKGIGGAAQASTSTAGNSGGVSSVSTFGSGAYLIAAGRNAATGIAPAVASQGGQLAATSAPGTTTVARVNNIVATGGINAASGGDGANNNTGGTAGGTAGAGQQGVTPINANGGLAGPFNWGRYANGGTQGIGSTKTNPITGANITGDFGMSLGAGGMGGWANADGTASAGSNGGNCGGGGGAGGSTPNGTTAPAGGDGGDGCGKVVTWF